MSVLLGHAGLYFLQNSFLNEIRIQILGVLVFFLLSGFLITHSVFQKHGDQDYGFRDYFIDRFSRIYTAYIPALILISVIDCYTLPFVGNLYRSDLINKVEALQHHLNVFTFFGNLAMLQDFPVFTVLRKFSGSSDYLVLELGSAVPLWTIAIEWWTYMAFGLIAIQWYKVRKPLKSWQWPILLFTLVAPVYHAIGGYDECLTLIWLLGMVAAVYFSKQDNLLGKLNIDRAKQHRMLLGIFLASTCCAAGRLVSRYVDTKTFDYAELQFGIFLAISVFSLFLLLDKKFEIHKAVSGPVKFIADYSFSLYLIHFSIINYLYARFPGNDSSLSMFWGSVLISNLIAIAFWWLFERHHRAVARWLKRVTAPASCRQSLIVPRTAP